MKTAISLTLETSTLEKARLIVEQGGYKNLSQYADKIIKEAIEKDSNPLVKSSILELQIEELLKEQEKNNILIDKVEIEGNLREREAAKKIKEETAKREKERLDELKRVLKDIKTSKVYEELIKDDQVFSNDLKVLGEYAARFQVEGIKIGSFQLRQLLKEGLLNGNN